MKVGNKTSVDNTLHFYCRAHQAVVEEAVRDGQQDRKWRRLGQPGGNCGRCGQQDRMALMSASSAGLAIAADQQ
jgi:hypothetical protein